MRIKQYGITLRRVEKRDIEIIRKYRNSEHIKKTMIYKDYISKKMQLEWFKKIENKSENNYFIIINNRKKIGLINVNEIGNNFAESGLFMFKDEYYNNYLPVIASVIMINSTFYAMNNVAKSIIKVLKNNKNAISFNISLGYKIINEENENYYIMEITKESCEKKIKKIKKAIENIRGQSQYEITFEPLDFKNNVFGFYKPYIENAENYIVKKIKKQNYLELTLNI